MDELTTWVTRHKIPVGSWVSETVDDVKAHFAGLFDITSSTVGSCADAITSALLWVPPPLMAAGVMAAVLYFRRSWKLALFVGLAQAFIINQGYWEDTMATLSLILFSASISMVVGVPLGIAAANSRWVSRALHPLLDLMQTLPTFVYLIPTLVLFGLGAVPGMVSTIIFAIPAPIRMTELGIASVPRPLIEAGESFGATRWQLLWKVQLPSALPMIQAGLTQCIMLSLSMVVIAALVGAGGLGVPVVRALNTVQVDVGFEAGFAIVLLAIVLDRAFRPQERRQ